jgi:hypothetical protein
MMGLFFLGNFFPRVIFSLLKFPAFSTDLEGQRPVKTFDPSSAVSPS